MGYCRHLFRGVFVIAFTLLLAGYALASDSSAVVFENVRVFDGRSEHFVGAGQPTPGNTGRFIETVVGP